MVFKYGNYNPLFFSLLEIWRLWGFFPPPPKTNPLLQVVVPFSFGRQVAKFRHKK
jgi:hypothetical protein